MLLMNQSGHYTEREELQAPAQARPGRAGDGDKGAEWPGGLGDSLALKQLLLCAGGFRGSLNGPHLSGQIAGDSGCLPKGESHQK